MAQAASVTTEEAAMVRSPSIDNDILTLLMAHDFNVARIRMDNGAGKSRKTIDETTLSMSVEIKNLH